MSAQITIHRCCKCKKPKRKAAFSNNQMKKAKNNKTCKKCVKKNEKIKIKQPGAVNVKHTPKINNADPYIQSIMHAPQINGNELLKQFHNHCIGRNWFTEIHLGIKVNKNAANAAQTGLTKIFEKFPDTFVYHERVIIASYDLSFQTSIFHSIKDLFSMGIIGRDTRVGFKQLNYPNGHISSEGVTLYAGYTLQNDSISVLFDKEMNGDPLIQLNNDGFNDSGMIPGSSNEEHKLFQKSVKKIQKATNSIIESKDELNKISKNNDVKIEKNTQSIHQLKNKLKTKQNDIEISKMISHFEKRKKKLTDKQSEHSAIVSSIKKWNQFKKKLTRNVNQIFNQNNLEKIANLLNKCSYFVCNIDDFRGKGSHKIFQINNKTITISKKMRNNHFLKQLNEFISFEINNKFEKEQNEIRELEKSLDEKKEENMQQQNKINQEIKNKVNNLEELIEGFKINMGKYENILKKAENKLNKYLKYITKTMNEHIKDYNEEIWNLNNEYWNIEFAPNKLILSLDLMKEKHFISYLIQHKNKIIEWINKSIGKYKNISEYGCDYLLARFEKLLIDSKLIWYITVLRFLKLPISVYNLNIFMKYTKESMNYHFSNIPFPKKEIDIIMVITYIVYRIPDYKSKPFSFSYSKSNYNNTLLAVNNQIFGENETEMIKFFNDCLHFIIDLIPQYKRTITNDIFNKQIDIYMDRYSNATGQWKMK